MKILLTGASGYIGGNLLESLKDDYEIVAISRNTKIKKMKRMSLGKKRIYIPRLT